MILILAKNVPPPYYGQPTPAPQAQHEVRNDSR